MNEALLDVFRRTDYLVCLGEAEWASIHLDQPPPDPLLQRIKQQSWAFITAWNPQARERATDLNQTAQQALLAALRQWPGADIHPAIGIGPQWHEPSLFVIGPDVAYLDTLGRQHQQLAYVCGRGADAAALRWL
jgi:hypothetical protein